MGFSIPKVGIDDLLDYGSLLLVGYYDILLVDFRFNRLERPSQRRPLRTAGEGM